MDELEARLKALIERGVAKGKAARIRRVLPLINQLTAMGFSQTEIVAELNAGGLDITLPVFRQTLMRIRKQYAHADLEPAEYGRIIPPTLPDPSLTVPPSNTSNPFKTTREEKPTDPRRDSFSEISSIINPSAKK